jgi:hypothetical protein
VRSYPDTYTSAAVFWTFAAGAVFTEGAVLAEEAALAEDAAFAQALHTSSIRKLTITNRHFIHSPYSGTSVVVSMMNPCTQP